ncbi:MAG TPA: sigma-54 dependent transcriptional regulator [Candidatus Acidoferrum sp.]|jgi:DNA-binding NtrC family response regulator|nr:sigma-54 dependent transcriptional regulator [Candidatus Acidoferrum sp.]
MSDTGVVWIAADPASLRVLEIAEKIADTATTLLITGESGTGKDQLARWIHEHGSRRDAPFLKIDCASLPAELVESELFGHERGAFTGAVARKPGRFELAQGGTVVLDEVAALAPGMQAKLLRVLEERTFERLGGSETLRMDARLMALTNTDLAKAVSSGRFREDLFFRLNVLAIPVPPLRERKADIGPLAGHFLARLGPLHGRIGADLDPEAKQLLESYLWPGNVRELKNAVEHALVFAKEPLLHSEDFPQIMKSASSSQGLAGNLKSLEEIEREAIKATLEAVRYKIGEAAQILGISRKTLLEKRKKYGLT